MICEVPELAGNDAVGTKTANIRTRVKGSKKHRKESRPIKIEDEDVEYIGIENVVKPDNAPASKSQSSDLPKEDEKAAQEGLRSVQEGKGLIYEIAEELYIREKTISELEALAKPPFHKNFEKETEQELNKQAGKRLKTLISAAEETEKPPTFLPEPIYENNPPPVDIKHALLLEILFLIPFVNIAASVLMAMNPAVNHNIRTFCRAFLILAGAATVLLGGFLAGKVL